MENLNLGQLITSPQEFDAFHVAVAPVIAGQKLRPGQHVGFSLDYERSNKTVMVVLNPIGIIDPLLKKPVQVGQECWLWLYPNTVTSLRHHWTHPSFSPKKKVDTISLSIEWIEKFAEELDQTYEKLMEAAAYWIADENNSWPSNYTHDNSEKYKRVDSDRWPIFWEHYRIVTGVEAKEKVLFFTCSC